MKSTDQNRGFELGLSGLEHYSLHDFKQLLVRRKWTITSVALGVALAASVVTYFLPNRYMANTVIMIDPGKVPDTMVKSTATLSANERLGILRQQILSTARLAQIVDEFNLYGGPRRKKTQEEILKRMRKDIAVEPVPLVTGERGLGAFTISYSGENPNVAAQVANRLASLFIQENLKAREEQVLGTAEFLDREMEKAKKDLDEKAVRIQQLKTRHISELPESQSVHVQALTSLQLELRGEMDAMSRAQQQKIYFESMLSNGIPIVDLDAAGSSSQALELQTELAKLQSEQDQLETRYGSSYPDVQKKTLEIQQLQQQIEQLKPGPSKTAAASTAKPRNPVIESQIATLDQEMQKHAEREKDVKSQINYHESLLQRTPAVEQALTESTHEHENAVDNYKRLQDRKFAADISSDMETRQKGERFVILETAQPPEQPSEPNRPLIDGLALAGGLAIGAFLALLFELMDATVKTEREIRDTFQVPILAEVPWVVTVADKSRKRWHLWAAVAGNGVLALGYLGILMTALK